MLPGSLRVAVTAAKNVVQAICPQSTRVFVTSRPHREAVARDSNGHVDVEKLISEPTWSVASLLPSKAQEASGSEVSSKQLHHLLRLSALPPPKDAREEAKMLSTLSSQLQFVKDIQNVDTTGVEPLRSLRDETAQGEKEAEIGMEALKGALEQEELRSIRHNRIRRKRGMNVGRQEEKWDPLGTASKKTGCFFVVEGGRER